MKRFFILLAIITVAGLSITAFAQRAKDAEILYHRGVQLEEVKGELKEAIAVYDKLLKEFVDVRTIAAQALLRMGNCYEKLGQKESQAAYQRILRDFADQAEVAAEARARLAALAGGAGAPSSSALAVRRVWAGRDVDVMGSASPDGRYLTFVDWETGNLAVRDLTTGQKRALTGKRAYADSPEFALDSHVSPDAKLVAYNWYNKDDFFELRLIGFDGSDARVLYRGDKLDYLHPAGWFPDGKRLLVVFRDKNKNHQIVTLSPADGSVRVLKSMDWRAPGKIGISADGRYLVYDRTVREDLPQRDVFLVSVADGRETLLVEHSADDAVLGWAPEGDAVLFASDRAGTWDAWMVRVSAGKADGVPELVKKNLGQAIPMGFTRAGSFYYGLAIGMNDVYTATMDPATGNFTAPVLLSQRFVGGHSAPDWSPDGKSLAYLFQPPGAGRDVRVISIRALDSGADRQLNPELKFMRQPEWSPDGRQFLVRAYDKQGWGIFLVDSQTGQVTILAHGDVVWANHAWSPDGKAIFYQEGQRGLVRRDYASGEEKLLAADATPEFGRALAVSPDGSTLAYTAYNRQKKTIALKLMPAGGGEARELLGLPEQESIAPGGLVWMRDSKQILFVKKSALWVMPAEGGEPQKLNLSMKGLKGLRFHPNGRQVAFEASDSSAEVWIMENFLPPAKASK